MVGRKRRVTAPTTPSGVEAEKRRAKQRQRGLNEVEIYNEVHNLIDLKAAMSRRLTNGWHVVTIMHGPFDNYTMAYMVVWEKDL